MQIKNFSDIFLVTFNSLCEIHGGSREGGGGQGLRAFNSLCEIRGYGARVCAAAPLLSILFVRFCYRGVHVYLAPVGFQFSL